MSDQKLDTLLNFENLLNEFSGKRYHFKAGDDWKFSIVEVERIGKEKILVENLSYDEMYVWIKRRLKVILVEKK